MPVSLSSGLRAAAKAIRGLADPDSAVTKKFLGTVRAELKPVVRSMYQTSSDPYGVPWQLTKRGRPAYRSNKMANAVQLALAEGGLLVSYLIDWIIAADEGHTFGPRTSKGHSMLFDKKGRLVTRGKFQRAIRDAEQVFSRGAARLGGGGLDSDRFIKVDKNGRPRFVGERVRTGRINFGQRVLPPRQQAPRGELPPAWAEAVNRGAEQAMADLVARLSE